MINRTGSLKSFNNQCGYPQMHHNFQWVIILLEKQNSKEMKKHRVSFTNQIAFGGTYYYSTFIETVEIHLQNMSKVTLMQSHIYVYIFRIFSTCTVLIFKCILVSEFLNTTVC